MIDVEPMLFIRLRISAGSLPTAAMICDRRGIVRSWLSPAYSFDSICPPASLYLVAATCAPRSGIAS